MQPSRHRTFVTTGLFALAVGTATLLAPAAQEASAQEWSNTTELTVLFSGGNAGSSSLGLRNTLRREGESGNLRINVVGVRTDALRIQRFAEGDDPDEFVVREERDRERTAERYSAEGRYNWDLSERFFAYGSLGWDRNTFAGFDHRTVASLGAGNTLASDAGDWRLRLGYGATYTERRDVTPDPDRPSGFAGFRVTLDHEHEINERISAELDWRLDGTPEQWSDVRADLLQSVSSELSDRLSLTTTLELSWDNEPAVESVPLRLPDGSETGESVLVPLKSLDHALSLSLALRL